MNIKGMKKSGEPNVGGAKLLMQARQLAGTSYRGAVSFNTPYRKLSRPSEPRPDHKNCGLFGLSVQNAAAYCKASGDSCSRF